MFNLHRNFSAIAPYRSLLRLGIFYILGFCALFLSGGNIVAIFIIFSVLFVISALERDQKNRYSQLKQDTIDENRYIVIPRDDLLPIPIYESEKFDISKRFAALAKAYQELRVYVDLIDTLPQIILDGGEQKGAIESAMRVFAQATGSEYSFLYLKNKSEKKGILYGNDFFFATRIANRIDERKIRKSQGAHRFIKLISGPGYLTPKDQKVIKDLVYITMLEGEEILGLLIMSKLSGHIHATRDEALLLRAVATLMLQALKSKELNALLRKKERLAELGQMSATVAHEIRNPLGGIEILASYLSQELGENTKKGALAVDISQGVRRLERIVSGLLDYAGDEKLILEELPLKSVVEDALIYAKAHDPFEKVKFIVNIDYDLPNIKGDRDRLIQGILNLLINGIQALGIEKDSKVARDDRKANSERGRCHENQLGKKEDSKEANSEKNLGPEDQLEKKEEFSEESPTIWIRGRAENEKVLLEIRDNGPGISEELRPRIFEPFVSGKATGTGLGLAITKKIVEAHGGNMDFISNHSKGASIRLIFPLIDVDNKGFEQEIGV